MLKKLFENTSTKGTFKPIFPIYSLSDLYIIQKRAHNIKSRKTDEWGINGPISWTSSTKNVSKSPNLHPQWGRITLFTLLWDTLYVCFSIFFFFNFDIKLWQSNLVWNQLYPNDFHGLAILNPWHFLPNSSNLMKRIRSGIGILTLDCKCSSYLGIIHSTWFNQFWHPVLCK